MYGCGGLWVSHFFERESKHCCLFAVEKKSTKFCFHGGCEGESQTAHSVKNAPFNLMGPVGSGSIP
jgi:hypothetical protein